MSSAIETVYDDRRFRSRLEARYAVFFNSLGLSYQYEPEGFKLNGHLYLPDFKLPTIPLWVEVKGQEPTGIEELLISMLAGHTGIRGTIVGPLETFSDEYEKFHTIFFEDGGEDFPYFFCECVHCGSIGFQFDGRSARINCCDSNRQSKGDKAYNSESPRIINAYRKAMQARFEHGEKP